MPIMRIRWGVKPQLRGERRNHPTKASPHLTNHRVEAGQLYQVVFVNGNRQPIVLFREDKKQLPVSGTGSLIAIPEQGCDMLELYAICGHPGDSKIEVTKVKHRSGRQAKVKPNGAFELV